MSKAKRNICPAREKKTEKKCCAKKIVLIALIAALVIAAAATACVLLLKKANTPETPNKVDPVKYTQPPSRVGKTTGEAEFVKPYTLNTAASEADAVALVRVGSWVKEDLETGYTTYEAEVIETVSGSLGGSFTLLQKGTSEVTYPNHQLFAGGNELLLFLKKAGAETGADAENAYIIVGNAATVFYVTELPNDSDHYCVTRLRDWEDRMPKSVPNQASVAYISGTVYSNLENADPIWVSAPASYKLVFSYDMIKEYLGGLK